MQQLIKKYLIISICFFGLLSCNNYRVKGDLIEKTPEKTPEKTLQIPYFDSISKEYLYQAKIKAYGNQFNGILVVKKINNNEKRVALITDFGNTLMDFEIHNDEVKVNYMLDDLDKKIIVNKLKNYFQLLVNSNYTIKRINEYEKELIYITKLQSKRVTVFEDIRNNIYRLKQVSIFRKKVNINYYSADGLFADSIHFKSYEIPVEMKFYKRD
ncbi:MAG: hypothetical protein WED10_01185 [Brumimicrobium sp.]